MQEMKLGTSVSSVSCSYPNDTYTGRSILSYREPVIRPSLWEDVWAAGSVTSVSCLPLGCGMLSALSPRSVPLASSCHCFLSLTPLLYLFRTYFSSIPLVFFAGIFCWFPTRLKINCTLSQFLVYWGSERPLCKVMGKGSLALQKL